MKVFIIGLDENDSSNVKELLSKLNEISLVLSISNDEELLTAREKLNPDIVFIDLNNPSIDYLEITRMLVKEYREILIFALVRDHNMEIIMPIIHAGARNYMIKKEITADLLKKRLGMDQNELSS